MTAAALQEAAGLRPPLPDHPITSHRRRICPRFPVFRDRSAPTRGRVEGVSELEGCRGWRSGKRSRPLSRAALVLDRAGMQQCTPATQAEPTLGEVVFTFLVETSSGRATTGPHVG
jgi:hypothetical protein